MFCSDAGQSITPRYIFLYDHDKLLLLTVLLLIFTNLVDCGVNNHLVLYGKMCLTYRIAIHVK